MSGEVRTSPRPVLLPILAPLLASRAISGLVLAIGAGLIVASAAGLPAWRCPMRTLTGLPCPGCGMTRACRALLEGRWADAWRLHPFAPAVAAASVLIAASMVLPGPSRARLAGAVGRFEARTGASIWVLAALVLFGAARVLGKIGSVAA